MKLASELLDCKAVSIKSEKLPVETILETHLTFRD